MSRSRVMFIELKSGYAGNGPAWIDAVRLSKSRRSVFFQGKELLNIGGRGIQGNHVDIETGEEYWVSGVKKNGQDRHWTGGGPIQINPAVEKEYRKLMGHA